MLRTVPIRDMLAGVCLAVICGLAVKEVQGQEPEPVPVQAPRPADEPAAVPVDDPAAVPDVLPVPTLTPDFGIPEGLKTAPEILLPSLGYGKPSCFPLTPVTCFDVAYACYIRGLYTDAFAFASHGLKLCNHARLYLLKAMCEMRLNRPEDARSSIIQYRHAAARPEESFGLFEARERLNDAMRVRLELLLEAWGRM